MSFNSDGAAPPAWATTVVGSMRAETQPRKGASEDAHSPGQHLHIAEIYASLQGEGQWTSAAQRIPANERL